MLLGFDGFSAADFFAAAVGSQDQGATFGGGGPSKVLRGASLLESHAFQKYSTCRVF